MSERRTIHFAAGSIIAERYRIHRTLGGGAMGDVFLADDTEVGKFVALKVPKIPARENSALRAKLHGEVNLAQKVVHPNVCRVYDLIEDRGLLMLKMEFVDGETLEQILGRRIGTLASDEKLRIAYEICAGLDAIHESGIVHRDLKPANVMVDCVRRTVITDFGIARREGAVRDPKSGTIEYMAPEQLLGEAVGKKSDLYSLGLVLYELFAGEPALPATVEGRSAEELHQARNEASPLVIEDESIHPGIREVIEQCLCIDPEERPESACKIAERLPGETPVPLISLGRTRPIHELMLKPKVRVSRLCAWSNFAVTILGLAVVALLSDKTQLASTLASGRSPGLLAFRAEQIASDLGFTSPIADKRAGFSPHSDRLEAAANNLALSGPKGLAQEPLPPISFWYQHSSEPLRPMRAGSAFDLEDDPSTSRPGTLSMRLDSQGRLLGLSASRAASQMAVSAPEDMDWEPLLTAAGLDSGRLELVTPRWVPPLFADTRVAWEGFGPRSETVPIRIEAASLRGRAVAFETFDSRGLPVESAEATQAVGRPSSRYGNPALVFLISGLLLIALLLARRNYRYRVADWTAAFRLALFILSCRLLVWVIGVDHRAAAFELTAFFAHLSRALLAASLVLLIYIALEPIVRTFSPERSASGVRLLYGRVRDRLVGRDLMIGATAAVILLLWARLYAVFPAWLGLPIPRPDRLGSLTWVAWIQDVELHCQALQGLRKALAFQAFALVHGVLVAFFAVAALVVLRIVCRRPWPTRIAALMLFTALTYPAAGNPILDVAAALGSSALWLVLLVRFGFLCAATATALAWLLSSHPLTLDTAVWYFNGSLAAIVSALLVAAWGLYVNLGGRFEVPRWLLKLPRVQPDSAAG